MQSSTEPVTIEAIIRYGLDQYPGTVHGHNWGEQGIFYNPDNRLPKGVYMFTFKEKDGVNDSHSNVDREGVYRLNLGISKASFIKLFGPIPKRPPAGHSVDMDYDFRALDVIMPHPVYAWMAWICVLNPTVATFEILKPLISEAYDLAVQKYQKRIRA